MDKVDRATRSRMMSRVGRRDTGPEMVLRKALHKRGLRYRLHDRKLPGSPDLVFPRFRAVAFIHGCFWHAHGCRKTTIPTTQHEFWTKKFHSNQARDRASTESLIAQGWRVLVVWECASRGKGALAPDTIAQHVDAWLHGDDLYGEIPQAIP